MTQHIKYKKRYYSAIVVLWVILFLLSMFSYNTNKKLETLQKEIQDHKTQQMIQMYIDSGWMPIDTTTKHKTKKLKKEK